MGGCFIVRLLTTGDGDERRPLHDEIADAALDADDGVLRAREAEQTVAIDALDVPASTCRDRLPDLHARGWSRPTDIVCDRFSSLFLSTRAVHCVDRLIGRGLND